MSGLIKYKCLLCKKAVSIQRNSFMRLFDSHCHLNCADFDRDRPEVLEQCFRAGIVGICIPAVTAGEWFGLLSKTTGPVQLFPALGLHPCFLEDHDLQQLEYLDQLLATHKDQIVAVGETGLDFYNRDLSEKDRKFQQQLFSEHLRLACQHQLPVIIHARKSHDQILKTLRRLKPPKGGIIHAFSGSGQQACQYIELGFKLGFGGGITYPRASKTRHLAAILPLESIVLETDAPDMPLQGFQGQRNSPVQLFKVAQCLGELRQTDLAEVAETTFENCLNLFNCADKFSLTLSST